MIAAWTVIFSTLMVTLPPSYQVFEKSGDLFQIVSDPRLAAVANWAINRPTVPHIWELKRALNLEGVALEQLAVYYQSGPEAPHIILKELEKEIANIPKAPLITKGTACIKSPDGHKCALIVASAELRHEPFPISPPLKEVIHFSATFLASFKRPEIWLIRPNGTIAKIPLIKPTSTTISALLSADSPGQYQLELVATGSKGPKILLNVPIFWGTEATFDHPPWLDTISEPPHGSAEEKLFALINLSRQKAGIRPLKTHDTLSRIAQKRALELAKSGELAHQDPQGTPADLLQKAGVNFTNMAENIAHAADVLSAHYLLMSSPLHRKAILNSQFTHLGLGVAHRPTSHGSELFIAEEFSQVDELLSAAALTQDIMATIQNERLAHGLKALRSNNELENLAKAQIEAASFSSKNHLPTLPPSSIARDLFVLKNSQGILKSANILGEYSELGIAVLKAPPHLFPAAYTVILLFQ